MLDLAATSESLRHSHHRSLEILANSRSRQIALFGVAALAIFAAGQSAAHHGVPAKAPQVAAAKPAPLLLPAAMLRPASHGSRIGGSPVLTVLELRP